MKPLFATAIFSAALLSILMLDASAAGAIAAAPDGTWGKAFDYAKVEDAEEEALDQCGDDECKVVVSYKTGCAAYARDPNPHSTVWGAARGADKVTAQNSAIYQCQRARGQNCQSRAAVCDKK